MGVISRTQSFSLCSFRGESRAVISWCLNAEACSLSEVLEVSFVQLPRPAVRGWGKWRCWCTAARGARHAHKVGVGVKGQQHTVQPGAKRTARRNQWDLAVLSTLTGGHSDSPKHPLKNFPQITWSAADYETDPRCAISQPPPLQRYEHAEQFSRHPQLPLS